MGQLFEDLVAKWGEVRAKEIVEERALEEKKASARRMIARGKLTLEEIAEDSDLPIEVVRDLAGLQLA